MAYPGRGFVALSDLDRQSLEKINRENYPMRSAPDYLNPTIPADVAFVDMPLTEATPESLAGYGCLVADADEVDIEIVRWPAQGQRPVDPDTGDEGGTREGVFESFWRGDILYGHNSAVAGDYILGYATRPDTARDDHTAAPDQILLWHANYHPDGGQLFMPLDNKPFIVPLALPGDDVQPGDFVAFTFDGSTGLYIHPNIWHEGVFTRAGSQRFFDKQGAVHARVSVDFPQEFGCLLRAKIN
tara:strand:- start:9314 stop:10042 length:729 start_codon:yes stop_codon:yes gene_type:complete